MLFMFYYASSFEQDLSMWCVSKILSAPDGFDLGAKFQDVSAYKPKWGQTDTCPSTDI